MLTITPHAMDAPVSRHAFRATFNLVLQTIALFNINSTRGTLTHSDDCGRHGLERIPLRTIGCMPLLYTRRVGNYCRTQNMAQTLLVNSAHLVD